MTEINAIILREDGNAEIKYINTINELHDIIGGWYQIIGPRDQGHGPWTGYCDEDGKLKGLPVNEVATLIAEQIGWWGSGVDVLCGTIVLVGAPDAEGNDTDVPDLTLQHVLGFFRHYGTVDMEA